MAASTEDWEYVVSHLTDALTALDITPNYGFGQHRGQAIEYVRFFRWNDADWEAAVNLAVTRYLDRHRHYLAGMLR